MFARFCRDVIKYILTDILRACLVQVVSWLFVGLFLYLIWVGVVVPHLGDIMLWLGQAITSAMMHRAVPLPGPTPAPTPTPALHWPWSTN